MTTRSIALTEHLRKLGLTLDGDGMRQLVERLAQELIEPEATQKIGAGKWAGYPGERDALGHDRQPDWASLLRPCARTIEGWTYTYGRTLAERPPRHHQRGAPVPRAAYRAADFRRPGGRTTVVGPPCVPHRPGGDSLPA